MAPTVERPRKRRRLDDELELRVKEERRAFHVRRLVYRYPALEYDLRILQTGTR
jgi:hypothetical protein